MKMEKNQTTNPWEVYRAVYDADVYEATTKREPQAEKYIAFRRIIAVYGEKLWLSEPDGALTVPQDENEAFLQSAREGFPYCYGDTPEVQQIEDVDAEEYPDLAKRFRREFWGAVREINRRAAELGFDMEIPVDAEDPIAPFKVAAAFREGWADACAAARAHRQAMGRRAYAGGRIDAIKDFYRELWATKGAPVLEDVGFDPARGMLDLQHYVGDLLGYANILDADLFPPRMREVLKRRDPVKAREMAAEAVRGINRIADRLGYMPILDVDVDDEDALGQLARGIADAVGILDEFFGPLEEEVLGRR